MLDGHGETPAGRRQAPGPPPRRHTRPLADYQGQRRRIRRGQAVKHLTTQQLADLLGMHPRTIADDRRDGSLGGIPFTRIGRAVRYRDDDVRQWLDQRRYIGGADTSLRAGSVPTGAHNPGHAGSTPAPATSRRLDGIAGARPRTPGRSAARPGTGADSGDSRERPAQPMQRGASGTHGAPHRQAGSTPAPASISAPAGVPPTSSSLSSPTPPAGAVSVNARMGRR
jgi:excisionase family DNA binding protein